MQLTNRVVEVGYEPFAAEPEAILRFAKVGRDPLNGRAYRHSRNRRAVIVGVKRTSENMPPRLWQIAGSVFSMRKENAAQTATQILLSSA